eukprot:Nk52_evm54s239 gene=Nk52_evmTU54s239
MAGRMTTRLQSRLMCCQKGGPVSSAAKNGAQGLKIKKEEGKKVGGIESKETKATKDKGGKPEKKKIKVEHIKIESSESENDKFIPPAWRQQLELIKQMRRENPAPVDSMGCEAHPGKDSDPKNYRFQVLISLMLSSQTKDEVNHAAMNRLREYGCTVDKLSEIEPTLLGELIYPVGFWRRKTEYIKKTVEILIRDYNGDIPDSIDKLIKLPGVGPKMAYICMNSAWGDVQGIGVDTHVHRIAQRMGWVKNKKNALKIDIKSPEDTRKVLESWLPREYWDELNITLVGFGQTICKPVQPKCGECYLKATCPFARKNKGGGTPKKQED